MRMRIYPVSSKAYWEGIENSEGIQKRNIQECFGFFKSRDLTYRPMSELIQKYNLRNKQILSIGPSFGHEEYHFYKNGNKLTFVDIDLYGVIETYLKQVPTTKFQNDIMNYFVGDVREFLDRDVDQINQFDVVYCSGVNPDEERRKKIIEKQRNTIFKCINFFPKRLFSKTLFREWPKDENPYADFICELSEKVLKRSGLLIIQSYAWGLNILANPHYVALIENQFSSANMQLLSVYCVRKAPRIQLVVAMKNNKAQAKKFIKSTLSNPEIRHIHGRKAKGGEVVKVYDLLESGVFHD